MRSILALILFLSSVSILIYTVDFLEVSQAFKSFHIGYFTLACATLYLHFVLRGYRLNVISGATCPSTSIGISFLSNLINLSLPLRLGELSKIAMLCIFFKTPPLTSAGVVVVERGFDLGIVFLILVLGLTGLKIETQDIKTQTFFFLVVFSAVALGLLVIKSGVLGRFPRAKTLFNKIGFDPNLFQNVPVSKTLALSVAIWGLTIAFHFFTVLAVGYQPRFMDLIAITIFNSLLISLPSSPGFVGPYQLSFVLAAQTMGINEAQMTAASLLSHAANYIVVVPVCIYYFKKLGIGFKDITRIKFSSRST